MLILISPAKTLDFETCPPTTEFTQPRLLEHAAELITVCQQLAPQDIAHLMKVSDKIAALNVARFANWQPSFTLDNAKQAIFAFKGDVYTGLDAESMAAETIQRAQQQLRILSGLYGLLKPLDLMQPYRLEMGTSLANQRGKNLYQFWGESITELFIQDIKQQEAQFIVNLASNEYYKAVKEKQLPVPVITPIFKDYKNGQYKVISFYAKKARGLMARYLIESKVDTVEELTKFNLEGYCYSAQDSTAHAPVFLREKPVN